MKKIFVFICLVFITISANAQLNVNATIKEEPQKVMTLQFMYSWLYKTDNGYSIWMVTDNKFDRRYNTIFLGETIENTMATLQDLKTIMEKEISFVEVKQYDGDLALYYVSQLGVKQLWVKQVGNAGKSWVTLGQIEKIIKYFENGVN